MCNICRDKLYILYNVEILECAGCNAKTKFYHHIYSLCQSDGITQDKQKEKIFDSPEPLTSLMFLIVK